MSNPRLADKTSWSVLCLAACAVAWTQSASAAEIVLRAKCQPSGPVVRLADVADVVSSDPRQVEALGALELFPAPPAGQPRFLRLRDVQDALLLRQVNLAEHRFSGASQVAVSASGESRQTEEATPSPALVKKAQQQVVSALARYLAQQTPIKEGWSVQPKLDAAAVKALATEGRITAVQGGQEPWEGSQRFEITVTSHAGPARMVVEAEISPSPMVVVTVVALPKGSLIRAGDVRLERAAQPENAADALRSLENAVDKETTQAIPAGVILQSQCVRPPVLVHRSEVVTVYSRSSGIRIRTTARAKEDGGVGELIAVESLTERKVFHARVTGVQEVEVYARAMAIEPGREEEILPRVARPLISNVGRSGAR